MKVNEIQICFSSFFYVFLLLHLLMNAHRANLSLVTRDSRYSPCALSLSLPACPVLPRTLGGLWHFSRLSPGATLAIISRRSH